MIIFTIIGIITVLCLIGAGLVQHGKNEQNKLNANSKQTKIAVAYHLVEAKKLADQGDYPNALKAVNEALQLSPNDHHILQFKAEVTRLLKEEIDFVDDKLLYRIERCEEAIQNGNYELAEVLIQNGLKERPNSVKLLELQSLVDSLMGKKEMSPKSEKTRYMQTIRGLIGHKELSKAVLVADFISKKYPEDEELKKISKALWKEYHGDDEVD